MPPRVPPSIDQKQKTALQWASKSLFGERPSKIGIKQVNDLVCIMALANVYTQGKQHSDDKHKAYAKEVDTVSKAVIKLVFEDNGLPYPDWVKSAAKFKDVNFTKTILPDPLTRAGWDAAQRTVTALRNIHAAQYNMLTSKGVPSGTQYEESIMKFSAVVSSILSKKGGNLFKQICVSSTFIPYVMP